jgi:hypothetical protein
MSSFTYKFINAEHNPTRRILRSDGAVFEFEKGVHPSNIIPDAFSSAGVRMAGCLRPRPMWSQQRQSLHRTIRHDRADVAIVIWHATGALEPLGGRVNLDVGERQPRRFPERPLAAPIIRLFRHSCPKVSPAAIIFSSAEVTLLPPCAR